MVFRSFRNTLLGSNKVCTIPFDAATKKQTAIPHVAVYILLELAQVAILLAIIKEDVYPLDVKDFMRHPVPPLSWRQANGLRGGSILR